MERNGGITLIALVVSIILLLILAGASISMLTGQNGILNKAREAKEITEISSEKEKIELAYTNLYTKYMTNNNEKIKNDIENDLQKLLGENKITVTNCGNGLDVLINEKNYYYTIEEDGTITGPTTKNSYQYAGDISKNGQYDGSSLSNAYRIECIEDFVAFSKETQTNDFDGKTIILNNNLNFFSVYSYENYATTVFGDLNKIEDDGNELLTEMTTGTGFLAISSNSLNKFSGTFNGNGFSIKNIYMKSDNKTSFFIENKGTVKNIKIDGNINSSNECAGIVLNNYGEIRNVVNNTKIISTINKDYVGIAGICSNNYGTILNSVNQATVISSSNTGGICAILHNDGKILNCYNEGSIQVTEGEVNKINTRNAGGILAMNIQDSGKAGYIFNCYNIGDIISDKCSDVGIVGFNFSGEVIIKNCYTDTKSAVGSRYAGKYTEDNVIYLNQLAKYSEEYIKSQQFADELNNYVENNLDKSFSKWIVSGKNIVTIDFSTVWDGNKWSNYNI